MSFDFKSSEVGTLKRGSLQRSSVQPTRAFSDSELSGRAARLAGRMITDISSHAGRVFDAGSSISQAAWPLPFHASTLVRYVTVTVAARPVTACAESQAPSRPAKCNRAAIPTTGGSDSGPVWRVAESPGAFSQTADACQHIRIASPAAGPGRWCSQHRLL